MKYEWRIERVDNDDGEICYEAHGVREDGPSEKDSFIRFEGINCKEDAELFLWATDIMDERVPA